MAKKITRSDRQRTNGIGPANAWFSRGQQFSQYAVRIVDTHCRCGCGKLIKNCPNKKENK